MRHNQGMDVAWICQRVAIAITALVIAPGHASAQTPKKAPIKVEVHGLQLNRQGPHDSKPPGLEGYATVVNPGGEPGTMVTMLVTDTESIILGLDGDACQLVYFKDDKGTDLAAAKPARLNSRMRSHSEDGRFTGGYIGQEGHYGFVYVMSTGLPARGASQLTMKGNLAVRVASGEIRAEKQDIALAVKSTMKLGNVTATIAQCDPSNNRGPEFVARPATAKTGPRTWVEIRLEGSAQELETAGFGFFDSTGKQIESEIPGEYDLEWKGGAPTRKRIVLILEGTHKTVTVKAANYAKFETIQVPFSLETGLGF
jgi:hypothetical protein